MKAKVFINQKVGNLVAATGILAGMLLPAAFPMLASADQLASRSVELSSSTADASGVNYQFSFTPSANYEGLVVDFCDATTGPIAGQDCTAPTGFDISSAATSSNVTFTTGGGIGTLTTTDSTASHLEIQGTSAQNVGTNPTVVFNVAGVHNPTAAGSFYARIYTYATSTAGWTNVTTLGTTVDTGGIALATTNQIGVQAAVRESLQFCVAGDDTTTPNTGTAYITDGCDLTGRAAPDINLGHSSSAGQPLALDTSATDTADVYSQISTNAVAGAVVRMKNSNDCGGLMRVGASGCDIAAAQTGNAISPGTAMFGMKLGTTTTGTGTITPLAPYDTSNYGMTYSGSTGSGVSSTYGDPIYNTDGGPIANGNVPMTFGASAAATTPAGLYKANMSLVATGTF
jgi:hypothetical protein